MELDIFIDTDLGCTISLQAQMHKHAFKHIILHVTCVRKWFIYFMFRCTGICMHPPPPPPHTHTHKCACTDINYRKPVHALNSRQISSQQKSCATTTDLGQHKSLCRSVYLHGPHQTVALLHQSQDLKTRQQSLCVTINMTGLFKGGGLAIFLMVLCTCINRFSQS